jgi:hypothetical protein
VAEGFQDLLEGLFDQDVDRATLLPFGRKGGETVPAVPGALLDFLKAVANVADAPRTGQMNINAPLQAMPALGAGSMGVKGALGVFGGRLRPPTSNVRQLSPAKRLREEVDPRIGRGEHKMLQEDLTLAGKDVTTDNIRQQLRINDLNSQAENEMLRIRPSQVAAIETDDPLLAAMLARQTLRSKRGGAKHRNDPLEKPQGERMFDEATDMEGFGHEMFQAGESIDADDISMMNKLFRVIQGSFDRDFKHIPKRITQDETSGPKIRQTMPHPKKTRTSLENTLTDLQKKLKRPAIRFRNLPANEA